MDHEFQTFHVLLSLRYGTHVAQHLIAYHSSISTWDNVVLLAMNATKCAIEDYIIESVA
jgi:hypothetical protein